jgi:hypothetical protein
MITGQPEQDDPFRVCRLPLGAYQFATFVNLPDTGYADQFGNVYQAWTPPVYTVTVRSAEEGFQAREAMLVLDTKAMDKLIVTLHAAAHPTSDNIASLESLMQTQEYGEFRR